MGQFRLIIPSSACIMCSRILIISLLVASSFAHKIPVCKHETQDITVKACTVALKTVCGPEADGGVTGQVVAPDTVCADVVDKICVVADDEATGCNSITRKVCLLQQNLSTNHLESFQLLWILKASVGPFQKAHARIKQLLLEKPHAVCLNFQVYFAHVNLFRHIITFYASIQQCYEDSL